MRIVSLLPSATEIVCALGLEAQLVGLSHSCDYPRSVTSLPRVTRSAIDASLPSREIDRQVSRALREGRSLYEIDDALLESLRPDVVITQELCDVCAVDFASAARAVAALPGSPQLVSLAPATIADIVEDVRRVGAAVGAERTAEQLAKDCERRLDTLRRRTDDARRPRVLTLEWFDPPFIGGHWVPEQVQLAGGENVFGAPGEPSRRVTWAEIARADAELAVLLPCGYDLPQTLALAGELRQPEWQTLRAVQEGRVFAVDATNYFSRSSLRVIEGAEILGHILHPDRVPPPNLELGWQLVDVRRFTDPASGTAGGRTS